MQSLKVAELTGKRVLVRVDFNVPLNDLQEITDDRRIRAALPTINYCASRGARLFSARIWAAPKGQVEPKLSLKPVAEHLMSLLEAPASVQFLGSMDFADYREAVSHLQAGEMVLLENLRFHPEEKQGDAGFAKQLAELAEVYVNDAFGTVHRAHASTSIVASQFSQSYPGLLMQQELDNGRHLLEQPGHPFVLISGGAKVSDKIAILDNLMGKVDTILIGGGMAYTFIHAQGGQIGNSLLEDAHVETAKRLLEMAEANNTRIVLPEDSVIADAFEANANHKVVPSDAIPDGWMGLDMAQRRAQPTPRF